MSKTDRRYGYSRMSDLADLPQRIGSKGVRYGGSAMPIIVTQHLRQVHVRYAAHFNETRSLALQKKCTVVMTS